MKVLNKIAVAGLMGVLLLTGPGCQKVLDEKNKSNIQPDYFQSANGLESAMAGAYSQIRALYTTEGTCYMTMAGTDDAVRGFGTNSQLIDYTLTTQDGNVLPLWNIAYQAINSCNGVIEFAPASSLSASEKQRLMGEAKFLRAWFYFMLVTTFGDVTLNTKFVTEPSTAATRDAMGLVYDQIVKDLTEAVAELPARAVPSPGRAAKGAALHLLAKVYLTRGWSTAAKATDFADAYTTANQLITQRTTYGNNANPVALETDYSNIWREGNEYGTEVLWVVDRSTNPVSSETPSYGTGNPGGKFNGAHFFHRPNYPTFNTNVNGGITGAPVVQVNPVDRDVQNGRPFGRIRPSNYTLDIAFAERVNDSRYDKTFQLIYKFNRPGPLAGTTPVTITVTRASNPNDPMGSPLTTYTWVKNVDTALWLLGRVPTEAERRASKSFIVQPSVYDNNFFPSMKKYDDSTKLHTNDASDRPFIMMRFGETYLIAAEAAFKLNNNVNAAAMINILRTRAAYRATNTALQNSTAAAAIQVLPAAITSIDFILDERTREMYGEWMRWYDLVRTQRLAARLTLYNPIPAFNPTKHILRPIPQTFIDLVTTGPKYPQNPGY